MTKRNWEGMWEREEGGGKEGERERTRKKSSSGKIVDVCAH